MMLTSSVNYKDSYFKHPVLIAIHVEPTHETLHHLKNELKANGSSVPTTLGGVNHGYLGMVLTPEEYCRIAPKDPFTWTPNPDILVPNRNGMAAQITSAENNHRLTKKLYLETLFLENFHPTDHRGHRHKIYLCPLQPCHRTNYTTCPDNPQVSSQQLQAYCPPAT